MSSKCTAAKAYDILGIYDFPDNFDALNGLHSYLYTNSDMVVEALASQKYDLARDIVTAIETVDKDGSYDDCAFYVSRDGIRIRRISLKASLTSRLIDFKYLREAEAPAYTHGVSNDAFDYEFDDDDIPVFSAPEDL